MTDNETPTTASAVQYTGSGAPRVVATGEGEIAQRIVSSARANDVPIIEDQGLAQVLGAVPLGDEIPENLYIAVAEVLVHIYNLDQRYHSYD